MSDDFQARFNDKQTATIWEVDGVDSAGDPQLSSASPRQIRCRWEDKNAIVYGGDGEEFYSVAQVFVSEDLKVGDFLFLGTSVESDPTSVVAAYEIKGWEKTPSPRGDQYIRKAILSARRAG